MCNNKKKVLGEKVNAHLPEYSTLKSSGIFSSKRFELECSSSVVEKKKFVLQLVALISTLSAISLIVDIVLSAHAYRFSDWHQKVGIFVCI